MSENRVKSVNRRNKGTYSFQMLVEDDDEEEKSKRARKRERDDGVRAVVCCVFSLLWKSCFPEIKGLI